MLTKDNYMIEVEKKFITRRNHPSFSNLVILNYTDKATYEKRWNDMTLNCRGLIIDEITGEIVARPFPKFFNFGEFPEYEIDIPFEETPEFTIKLDGSLGISYKVNGKIYWATRGSFESDQAKAAQTIWNNKYSHVNIPNEITLLVEIIDPVTKVVVDYSGLSDLIIIGAVNRFTGEDYSYSELVQLSHSLGMNVTEQKLLTIEEAVNLKQTIDFNQEGWVLRWSNGKRIKIKGDQYMEIHKIAYGLSDKLKTEYWKDGKMNELIVKMPEEFRTEIEQFNEDLNKQLNNLNYLVEEYLTTSKNNSQDRKSFAIHLTKNAPKEYFSLVFKGYDNKLSLDDIREHIYRNYRDYVFNGVK
ncbi:RNA ligase [Bacillus spongiae]|uniref:RNA ligase n=1 Tax=Bacillus spongiae TaxID=2683610 RepID=A0ABU8HC27_9BACI